MARQDGDGASADGLIMLRSGGEVVSSFLSSLIGGGSAYPELTLISREREAKFLKC
jgi:hypothetical protein